MEPSQPTRAILKVNVRNARLESMLRLITIRVHHVPREAIAKQWVLAKINAIFAALVRFVNRMAVFLAVRALQLLRNILPLDLMDVLVPRICKILAHSFPYLFNRIYLYDHLLKTITQQAHMMLNITLIKC